MKLSLFQRSRREGVPDEAEILSAQHLQGDRIVRWALATHTLLAFALASVYGTWGITWSVSLAAVAMFVVASSLLPGAFLTRSVAGICLQVFCALHIYQLHGLAEMHFFFFTGFTLMIVYGDWRAMWPGALLIIAQHVLFAYLTNVGIDVAFFPEAYVTPMKLAFHFGIAIVHVAICGYFAHLHRTHALEEVARRRHVASLADEAEEASRTKSAFLANMSHEIRTPLTAILGYADLLLEKGIEATDRDMVATIRRNGEHLLAVINDILDVSKIEAGKLVVERLPCSPREILADVVTTLRARAEAKGLLVACSCQNPIPDRIETDPTRLRQILLNLGSNAVKFTERGSVSFVLSHRVEPGAEQGHLAIAVVDTGIGLEDEVAATLFEPFRQADASTSRRFGGTGLGLVISRRLARALGGDITLRSVKGRGSRFEVTVETGAVGAGSFDDRPITDKILRPVVTPAVTTRLSGRVLLAEDGPDNQRLIRRMLERSGASVEVAENGLAALRMVEAARSHGTPFDLVLMDMQMPELDGYAATRILRERGIDVPVVAVTAHAMAGDRARCLEAGCDEYLTKPIAKGSLLAVCAPLLAAAAQRGAPSSSARA